MTPELKAHWIEKLTDGSYKRGTCRLRTVIGGEYHHCCLAVLAEITGMDYIPSGGWLNRNQLIAVGLSDEDQKRLSGANDGAQYQGINYPREVIDIIVTLPRDVLPVEWHTEWDDGVLLPTMEVNDGYGFLSSQGYVVYPYFE